MLGSSRTAYCFFPTCLPNSGSHKLVAVIGKAATLSPVQFGTKAGQFGKGWGWREGRFLRLSCAGREHYAPLPTNIVDARRSPRIAKRRRVRIRPRLPSRRTKQIAPPMGPIRAQTIHGIPHRKIRVIPWWVPLEFNFCIFLGPSALCWGGVLNLPCPFPSPGGSSRGPGGVLHLTPMYVAANHSTHPARTAATRKPPQPAATSRRFFFVLRSSSWSRFSSSSSSGFTADLCRRESHVARAVPADGSRVGNIASTVRAGLRRIG